MPPISPNTPVPDSATGETYVPKVGDRVRHPDWDRAVPPVTVTAVGRRHFLADDGATGTEYRYYLHEHWVKVEPEPEDVYGAFLPDGRLYVLCSTTKEVYETGAIDAKIARFTFAGWVE